ncbi:colicin E3-like toxin immunity protein [Pseudomonas sp. HY7a-MNA-CIBAN-0227]|uniref:colicin E3-like toxin immunity protein n=1 Tax=Pseudomonas sp. HY7a-MNA-CIBAN-0227 TaxID=3140474 RepID=UPI0033317412
MGLKLRLQWFDETTERGIGMERSTDIGDDDAVVTALGLSVQEDVNNGVFELREEWLTTIQPYFLHKIIFPESDYFLALDYRESW